MGLTPDSQIVPHILHTSTDEAEISLEAWPREGQGILTGKLLSWSCQGGGEEVFWVHGISVSLHDVTSFEYYLRVQEEDSEAGTD